MDNLREKITKSLITFGVAFAVGLTGCGGGGGDDDDTDPVTFDGTSSGTVAKGIVQFGTVTAEELDVNGDVIRSVGTAQTDASGDYTLDIGDAYAGGIIRLTLSADGTNTTMVCDVQPDCAGTAYGETITLASTFSMIALLPSVDDGSSVSAQITPLTQMAASRVAAGGSYTSEAVNSAYSEINQMLGIVDVLNVPPLDITNPDAVETSSEEELLYSVFTAGLGVLIFDGDLTTRLEELADSFSDGLFDDQDAITIESITASVREQVDALESIYPDTDFSTVLHVVEVIDSLTIDGVYDPEPSDTADLSDLEQAKALVSDIRTLVSSIEELQSPADAFRVDLELTSTVVDKNAQALFDFSGLAVESVIAEMNALLSTGDLDLGQFYADIGDVADGVSFILSESDAGGLMISMTTTTEVHDVLGVDMNLTFDSNLPASNIFDLQPFDQTETSGSITGSVENAATSIALTDMNLIITYASSTTLTPVLPLELEGDAQFSSVVFTGEIEITDIDTSASFIGDTSIELIPLDADPTSLSLSMASLDGTFADSISSFNARLSLTVNNAATIDTIALLSDEPSLLVNSMELGDTAGFSSYPLVEGYTMIFGLYDSAGLFDPTIVNQTCFSVEELPNLLCESGDPLDTQSYFYSHFIASYPDATSVGDFVVGYDPTYNFTRYYGYLEFNDVETAEDYVQVTLSATLDLALDGYPDTTAVVTVDRTALDGGDAIITLIHDGSSITLNGSLTNAETSGVGIVEVNNPDGVVLTMSVETYSGSVISDITGEITVDGVNQATIEETDPGVLLVRYIDGTFESLY